MRTVVPVHAPVAALRGRDLVLAQRAAADLALHLAARRAGAPAVFPRDPAGAPVPHGGWWWSTAHTGGLAVAAVAPAPVGVDVERLARPRLQAARRKLARELERLGRDDDAAVVSLWSAKEAVVKRAGVGVAGLPACTLVRTEGPRWTLSYEGVPETVHVRVVGEHVVSVAAGALPVGLPLAHASLEVSA